MGIWNVDALERYMSAAQFFKWEAYASLEPFDEVRADIRAASIAYWIFSMAVAPEHRLPFDKFFEKYGLKFDEPYEEVKKKKERQQSPQEIEAVIRSWVQMSNEILALDNARRGRS